MSDFEYLDFDSPPTFTMYPVTFDNWGRRLIDPYTLPQGMGFSAAGPYVYSVERDTQSR
jgi:hypothetical protein